MSAATAFDVESPARRRFHQCVGAAVLTAAYLALVLAGAWLF